MITPNEEQKEFAKEIADKFWVRFQRKGPLPIGAVDCVRAMIADKLAKEEWRKNSGDSNFNVKSAV